MHSISHTHTHTHSPLSLSHPSSLSLSLLPSFPSYFLSRAFFPAALSSLNHNPRWHTLYFVCWRRACLFPQNVSLMKAKAGFFMPVTAFSKYKGLNNQALERWISYAAEIISIWRFSQTRTYFSIKTFLFFVHFTEE